MVTWCRLTTGGALTGIGAFTTVVWYSGFRSVLPELSPVLSLCIYEHIGAGKECMGVLEGRSEVKHSRGAYRKGERHP